MANSTVKLNGTVIMTVNDTTAVTSGVADGTYFYGADGVKREGEYVAPTAVQQATPTISVNTSTGLITATSTQSAGVVSAGTKTATEQLSVQAGATITPSTSQQTAVAAGKYTTGNVVVSAMPSGSATTPATTITANPSISVSSSGLITATTSATKSVTPTVSAGYVSSGTAGTVTVSGSNTEQLSTSSGTTVTPSSSQQTINVTGKYMTGNIVVDAVASGTAGTPTATKGTVSSNSVTVTPSVTNTTGYITGGTITGTAVTVSASELVSGTKSITTNGTADVTNYASVDVNVAGGGGGVEEDDVTFIDYDGTILYSYSATDFAALSAMPANPSHTGLTAQGWNWSLSDAKTFVNTYKKLWIGQLYVTNDGKTRIYVHLENDYKTPILGCCPNGTVVVDWGDGSATTTLTGTSDSTSKWTSAHAYSTAGDYMITLSVSSGRFTFAGGSGALTSGAYILRGASAADASNAIYNRCVYKIELGSNVRTKGYAFSGLSNLETITMASGTTLTANNTFYNCWALKSAVLPSDSTFTGYNFSYCISMESVSLVKNLSLTGTNLFDNCNSLKSVALSIAGTDLPGNTFYYCYTLKNVVLPNAITSLGSNAFSSCYDLEKLNVPTSLTTVNTSALASCRKLTSYTLPNAVSTLGTTAFSNCFRLDGVNIPTSTTTIPNSAFATCYSLRKITIPSGITSIGTNAFSNNYSLTEIHFKPTSPPALAGTNAFGNLPKGCIIYVPTGYLSAYTSASNYPSSATYTYIEE